MNVGHVSVNILLAKTVVGNINQTPELMHSLSEKAVFVQTATKLAVTFRNVSHVCHGAATLLFRNDISADSNL